MIVILVIVALVAAVSIYDYFNTRTWQQVTSTVRNEAVFENRNKKYGAFVIRRDYNRNFILILLGMIGGVGVIYAATSLTRGGASAEIRVKVPDAPTTIPVDIPKKKEEQPKIEKAKLVVPPPTNKFTEPKVVTEPPKDPVKIDPKVPSGIETIPEGGDPLGKPGDKGTPEGDLKGEGEVKTDPPKGPQIPDVFAEFPGGKAALMKFLGDNLHYPQGPAELGVEGKCYIRFIVSKTGDISEITVSKNIKFCPECGEEAKRVVKKMPRWKPGIKKGEAIDSYFSLPIVFELEKEN